MKKVYVLLQTDGICPIIQGATEDMKLAEEYRMLHPLNRKQDPNGLETYNAYIVLDVDSQKLVEAIKTKKLKIYTKEITHTLI